MRLHWPVVSLAFFLASGCASVGSAPARDGMEVLRDCDVACSGSIGTERPTAAPAEAAPAATAGDFHASVRLARVPVAAADRLLRGDARAADAFVVTSASADRVLNGSTALPAGRAFATAEAAPAASAGDFHASVRLARVPVAAADRLLRGDARAADAFVVTSASADRVLNGSTALPAGRAFATADRAAGVVAVERETSFVERFDFTESDAAAIVDPVVGVYTIGSRLTLLPRRNVGDDSWTVELALHTVDVDRPGLAAKVGVLGTGTPIRLDVPILARVETRTAATLARGESLVVVSPELLQDDLVVVAIVTPD